MFYFRAMARLTGVAFLILSGLTANAAELQRFEFVEPHMGTLFQIVLFAPDAAAAKPAAQAAFARIEELNRIMSDYVPDSELNRLCQQSTGTAVRLSAELFDILQRSQVLAVRTSGAFDVTIGPAVKLWRQSRRDKKLPTADQLLAARAACGFEKLRLDPAKRTATLLVPHMSLDLGGIAKGYAADAALAVITGSGFNRAMVAASGDLALGAPPPGKSGWSVKLAPFGENLPYTLTVIVAHVGVSTSGAAEQFVEIGGIRYSHIIDPTTGLGLTTETAATVIAPSATLSDGLDNACCTMPENLTKTIVDHWDQSVRVILHHRNADGSFHSEAFGTSPAGLLSSP